MAKLIAQRAPSWDELYARATAHGICTATPFQAEPWLATWYATLGAEAGHAALPIDVRDAATGETLAALPLVERVTDGLVIVEFADRDVTDYNLPVLVPGAELPPDDLVRAIAKALPHADILHLEKMPERIGAQANPLASLSGACASPLCANAVRIDGDWQHYQRAVLAKKFRKEMERSWRVFERDGVGARFEHITDADQAEAVLADMEHLQHARMSAQGQDYSLNQPAYRDFFRLLLRRGVASGQVVMTALRTDSATLVAALIGIRAGDSYAMVRLAQDGENWSRCSPGKLVIERTMHLLHGDGIRHFDFTTGNYAYKSGFAVETAPLVDVRLPLSLKGRVRMARESAIESVKTRLRRYPAVYDRIKSLAAAGSADHPA